MPTKKVKQPKKQTTDTTSKDAKNEPLDETKQTKKKRTTKKATVKKKEPVKTISLQTEYIENLIINQDAILDVLKSCKKNFDLNTKQLGAMLKMIHVMYELFVEEAEEPEETKEEIVEPQVAPATRSIEATFAELGKSIKRAKNRNSFVFK